MTLPDQWVTSQSILGFGGASLAVLVISIAVQYVSGRNWLLIPFVAALVVAFAVAGTAHNLKDFLEWLVAFVNACLLFCTATGFNELAARRPSGLKQQGRPKGLFVSWF